MVALFGAVVESSGQNNTILGVTNPTPGSSNILIGLNAGSSVGTGSLNTFIGVRAGNDNANNSSNTFVGYQTGYRNNGVENSYFGSSAGQVTPGNTGSYNTHIGFGAGYSAYGNRNTTLGWKAGNNLGDDNVSIGYNSGYLCQGSRNVFIGYRAADGKNVSDRLFIENGSSSSFPLIYGEFDNRKLKFNVNDGNASPFTSYVEINGNANASGLRFTKLNNLYNAPDNTTNKVLTVNSTGDVILVKDIGGGVSQNCSTANFVPLNNSTANQLICSQIYDNSTSSGIGTSVGIGYPTATAANAAFPTALVTGAWFSTSGTNYSSFTNFRLAVNGITRANGYLATSDKKFKKDIKPIENALATVQSLEGKTYMWNKEANKEMNFDGGGHSGFIAQDLEKVLPHLVATGENGDKAVNYMELMPYLVEAIKEQNSIIKDQQTQINDLKSQITENFKAQNQDLIELTNTKIISVSPNPSSDLISVSFNVEESVESAKLQVHDLNGNVISSLNISDRENNITRTLQKDNFGKGIYVVSLVINGKSIDTKKIVFN